MHHGMKVCLLAGMVAAGGAGPGFAGEHTRQWLVLRLAETLAIEDRCPGLYVDTGRLMEIEATVEAGSDVFAEARPAAAEIGRSLSGPAREAVCAAAPALYGAGGVFADGLLIKRK